MTHRFSTRTILSLAVITLLVAQPLPSHTAEQPSAGNQAGLADRHQSVSSATDLNGSLNDIDTMRQVLTTRWGFQSQHITMLTDQAATQPVFSVRWNDSAAGHRSIRRGLCPLPGHGSQVEDLNGDETDDHLDETLVPHDGRTGERPLISLMMNSRSHRLQAEGPCILIVSDSPPFRHGDAFPRHPDAIGSQRYADRTLPTVRGSHSSGCAGHGCPLRPHDRRRRQPGGPDGLVGGRYHGFFSLFIVSQFGIG